MKHVLLLTIFAGFILSNRCIAQDQKTDTLAVRHAIDSLIAVVKTFANQNQFDNALTEIQRAEQLALTHLGEFSSHYIKVCFVYGTYRPTSASTYREKINWLKKAKELQEGSSRLKAFYFGTIENLALVYKEGLELDTALQILNLAVDTATSLYGAGSYIVARLYWVQANIYSAYKDFEQVKQLSLSAIRICEASEKTATDCYTGALDCLAEAYSELGEYEKAESTYQKSISKFREVFGEESWLYGSAINNMAEFYRQLMIFEKALRYNAEAQSITSRSVGQESMPMAILLNNAGLSYYGLHQMDSAEACYLRSLAIKKRVLPPDHTSFGYSYQNLSQMYEDQQKWQAADSLLYLALNIFMPVTGSLNPTVGLIQNRLGRLNNIRQRYREALPNLDAAELAFSASLPLSHELRYNLYQDMAFTQYMLGNSKASDSCFLLANASKQENLRQHLEYFPENVLEKFGNNYRIESEKLISLLYQSQTPHPVCNQIAWDNEMLEKGFLLENRRALIRHIRHQSDDLYAIYRAWLETKNTISKFISTRDAYKGKLDQLELQADSLESILSKAVPTMQEDRVTLSWKDIQAALRPGECVIELKAYSYYPLRKTVATDFHYGAFLLTSSSAYPQYVHLCNQQSLSTLLNFSNGDVQSSVNSLYTYPNQPSTGDTTKSLFGLFLEPLLPYLGNCHTIYWVPDGLLHSINIVAVEWPELLPKDNYEFVQIESSRHVLSRENAFDGNQESVLFGDIAFFADTLIQAPFDSVSSMSENYLITTEFIPIDSISRGNIWNPLPGSSKEIASIQSVLTQSGFSSQLVKGAMATEESFYSLSVTSGKSQSPRIIHIATHGYFFPEKNGNPFGESTTQYKSVFEGSIDPMIRSGLILAGGNYAWKHGHPIKPGMEDGILTAYEICQMDLSNTELVVLSACETGLGDIRGNEGVFGLQRAFKIAGVKNLIMSLWKVPDAATAELMIKFYTNWLEKKMTIREALHMAQKEMREEGWEVYDWAGFVLVE